MILLTVLNVFSDDFGTLELSSNLSKIQMYLSISAALKWLFRTTFSLLVVGKKTKSPSNSQSFLAVC